MMSLERSSSNMILGYDDFFRVFESNVYGHEIESVNEGTGIRGFANRLAHFRVKNELADEIEMSKSIMDGIVTGLDSLNDNFDEIKKGIAREKDADVRGEKQKLLDSITKLLDDSRKSSWNLNDLIDEGEIDYAGFTANIGLANITYFGVLLFPLRAAVIMHKGYNYFFTLVKNTIRKSLVMVQLNFDQFENLIITKSFQSAGYMEEIAIHEKISEFYTLLQAKLFDDKNGLMKGRGRKAYDYAKRQMELAKQQIDVMMKNRKSEQQYESAYNCLDQYNNTYTKSLETLRSYTQEDVQKQLDAIKTSMTKLAGGDVDMQAYGEMIIAAAEEHAYKVSSSIYSRFSKMMEVFSLPNQKKMIDLIQEANKEQREAAQKKKAEEVEAAEKALKLEKLTEYGDELEEKGVRIFTETPGVDAKLGEYDEDAHKYKNPDGVNWDYDEYRKLGDDDKILFEKWLGIHPEVLKTCDETLRVVIPYVRSDEEGYMDYLDALISYIGPALEENILESILNYDMFLIEEAKKRMTRKDKENLWMKKINSADSKSELWNSIVSGKNQATKAVVDELRFVCQQLEMMDGDKNDWTPSFDKVYDGIMKGMSTGGTVDTAPVGGNTPIRVKRRETKKKDDGNNEKKYYLDLGNSGDQMDVIKEMFLDKPKVAEAALMSINDTILNSPSFGKGIGILMRKIESAGNDKKNKTEISKSTFDTLKSAIAELKDERSHDFPKLRKRAESVEKELNSDDGNGNKENKEESNE